MCDEYDEERMAAFWRKLETLEQHRRMVPEADETVEPLVRLEPSPAATPKAKPRTLVH